MSLAEFTASGEEKGVVMSEAVVKTEAKRMHFSTSRYGAPAPGEGSVPGRRQAIMKTRVLFAFLLIAASFLLATPAGAQTIRVDATPGHATNSFSPLHALGAGVDRLRRGAVDKIFIPPNLNESLASGWGTVSYRQNTELHVEAWHWNPAGTWSDPAGRGYFTGDATPTGMIRHSFAYPLPHRGFTRNQGTERGYSRLTDGDPTSYWKSNPYLTRAFTGEDDALHPQWAVVDLGSRKEVNAIRIAWAEPYAQTYQVQHWTSEDAMDKPTQGAWQTFPAGGVAKGGGGTVTLKLGASSIKVRYVRVLMTASSNTCDTHGPGDPRNCVGYAINEVYVGTTTSDEAFQDLVLHSPDQQQTATWCSSVDPWHAASDLSEDSGDQVGLDLFFTSGITRGLPAMVPVAMFYGIPEDAAAQMAYLSKRGYPISYVELGEEPDGQYMLPEDYGALYLQWATAIHRVDPTFKLGGPVFQGVNEDIKVWPDAQGKTSWFGRFLDYLRAHDRLADLAFMSFEHYPYEPCDVTWSSLYDEPKLVSHILQVWREDGLPPAVPLFITEVNIAWQTAQTFVDVFGALWLADYVGAFLTAGGQATYYFQYLPLPLSRGCHDSWGTFGMFTTDSDFRMKQHTSQFFASQLITREWAQPVDALHQVYPAASDVRDSQANVLVTAYALLRPDGQWALLVVNKDQNRSYPVQVVFHDASAGSDRFLSGQVSVVTFGSAQYQWHADGKNGHASPDGPAMTSTVPGSANTRYILPAASLTVLRGRVQ
jgi:hypothetical protein